MTKIAKLDYLLLLPYVLIQILLIFWLKFWNLINRTFEPDRFYVTFFGVGLSICLSFFFGFFIPSLSFSSSCIKFLNDVGCLEVCLFMY